MDDSEFKIRLALWRTFAHTGSIRDYLNYAEAVRKEKNSVKNLDQNQIL